MLDGLGDATCGLMQRRRTHTRRETKMTMVSRATASRCRRASKRANCRGQEKRGSMREMKSRLGGERTGNPSSAQEGRKSNRAGVVRRYQSGIDDNCAAAVRRKTWKAVQRAGAEGASRKRPSELREPLEMVAVERWRPRNGKLWRRSRARAATLAYLSLALCSFELLLSHQHAQRPPPQRGHALLIPPPECFRRPRECCFFLPLSRPSPFRARPPPRPPSCQASRVSSCLSPRSDHRLLRQWADPASSQPPSTSMSALLASTKKNFSPTRSSRQYAPRQKSS